jgi:two-component system chemotaxis response regulator CheB
VLVVDDSALMRKYLREMLEDAGFEVIAARDGLDALEKVGREHPDAITMDINMPVMDGLTALSHIMTHRPTPVVMVSSLTSKGAERTLEALALGAVDWVEKPGGTVSHNLDGARAEIVRKVGQAVASRPRYTPSARPRPTLEPTVASRPASAASASKSVEEVVLVGVSTGGPSAVELVVSALPADFPAPIVIAQHMPATFTGAFAERLNARCAMRVVEVGETTPLEAGTAYVARGDQDILLVRRGGRIAAMPVTASPQFTWHPSVSRLVASAMEVVAANNLLGVQLTGMGDDGAKELAALHRAGGHTIAESERTAVVYGMPRELVQLGGASQVLGIDEVASAVAQWASKVAAGKRNR